MQKPCFRRGVAKAEDAFGVAACQARNADRRVCKVCAVKGQGARSGRRAWTSARGQSGAPRARMGHSVATLVSCARPRQRANNRPAQLRRRLAWERRTAVVADVRALRRAAPNGKEVSDARAMGKWTRSVAATAAERLRNTRKRVDMGRGEEGREERGERREERGERRERRGERQRQRQKERERRQDWVLGG